MIRLEQEDQKINPTGIGLGLTISNNISKLLDPSSDSNGIKVKSTFGKGSFFYFDVSSLMENEENLIEISEEPRILINSYNFDSKLESKKAFKLTKFQSSPVLQLTKIQKKVLIVDDDLTNLFVLQKYLDFYGFDYLVAHNGLEALNTVQKSIITTDQIILILMDCNMPVMDGFNSTKSIIDFCKENFIQEIPIFGVTANVNNLDKQKGLKAGMKDILTKPVKRSQIKRLLDEISNKWKRN